MNIYNLTVEALLYLLYLTWNNCNSSFVEFLTQIDSIFKAENMRSLPKTRLLNIDQVLWWSPPLLLGCVGVSEVWRRWRQPYLTLWPFSSLPLALHSLFFCCTHTHTHILPASVDSVTALVSRPTIRGGERGVLSLPVETQGECVQSS